MLACVLYNSPKPADFKVLSREEDTLSIEALAMNREQRMVRKGFFTLLLGLGGLWLLWTQYRASERNTAAITWNGRGLRLILFSSINKPCINCGSARFGHSFWQSPVGLSGSSGHPVARYPPPADTTEESAVETCGGVCSTGRQCHTDARSNSSNCSTPKPIRTISEAALQDRNGIRYEVNQAEFFTGVVTGQYANKQRRIESHTTKANCTAHRPFGLITAETIPHPLPKRSTARQPNRVASQWQTQSVTPYQNGKRHGTHKEWDDKGKLRTETPYQNGELHGLAWHANGNSPGPSVGKLVGNYPSIRGM